MASCPSSMLGLRRAALAAACATALIALSDAVSFQLSADADFCLQEDVSTARLARTPSLETWTDEILVTFGRALVLLAWPALLCIDRVLLLATLFVPSSFDVLAWFISPLPTWPTLRAGHTRWVQHQAQNTTHCTPRTPKSFSCVPAAMPGPARRHKREGDTADLIEPRASDSLRLHRPAFPLGSYSHLSRQRESGSVLVCVECRVCVRALRTWGGAGPDNV